MSFPNALSIGAWRICVVLAELSGYGEVLNSSRS